MTLIREAQLPRLTGPMNIGFFASHNGTVMQAIVEAINKGLLDATPGIVISNNSASPALSFAKDHGVPAKHISLQTEGSEEKVAERLLEELQEIGVSLIVASGYMKLFPELVTKEYEDRMLNVHPALNIVRFGGRGMYGDRVHEEVLASGVKTTGVTIQKVAPGEYDLGAIVAQKSLRVKPDDTVESLRKRVQGAEKVLYVSVLQAIVSRRDQEESMQDEMTAS